MTSALYRSGQWQCRTVAGQEKGKETSGSVILAANTAACVGEPICVAPGDPSISIPEASLLSEWIVEHDRSFDPGQSAPDVTQRR